MKKLLTNKWAMPSSAALALTAMLPNAQAVSFGSYSNNGLVGVGRIAADSFDQVVDSNGNPQDTLGGIFSAMQVDLASVKRTGSAASGFTYSGILYGLPDRGFGDGATDYHPRVQTLAFSFTPKPGGAATQNQIQMVNTATTLFRDPNGALYTGFNADDATVTSHPQSSAGGLGAGKRSLDPEGIARMKDGSSFISDEYGPNIYHVDASGQVLSQLPLPEALVPKSGGQNFFNATVNGNTGRRGNRGMEGLSLSPDGTKLFAMLQSPAIQDGGAANNSRLTRILVYDLQSGTPTLEAEYLYELTLKSNPANNRHTPISEILAINNHQILVLERDNRGLGAADLTALYKRVNLAELDGASNILGSDYDKAVGQAGQLNLPLNAAGLPSSIKPVAVQDDFVNLIDPAQLALFGLKSSGPADPNLISEKWEGLALIPKGEEFPGEYYLLAGNDNDYLASNIYHNGELVGQRGTTVDMMVLAYDVTLPTSLIRTPDSTTPVTGLILFAATLGGLAALRTRRQEA